MQINRLVNKKTRKTEKKLGEHPREYPCMLNLEDNKEFAKRK